MAKKLYTKAEARARNEYSKIAYRIRKKVEALEEAAPNAKILGSIVDEDFAGIRWRNKMGLDTSIKHIKKLTNTLKKLEKSGALSLKAEKRRTATLERTLHEMGYKEITGEKVKELSSFLDMVREAGLASLFGSEWWIKQYRRAKKAGMTLDDLRRSLDKMSELKREGKLKKKNLTSY